MPTEKDKISAYVPEVVYKAFNKFKDDNKLSMSQAATLIFSEYLGVGLPILGQSQYVTGGLLDKINSIEKTLSDLVSEVNFLKSTSKPPEQLVIQSEVSSLEDGASKEAPQHRQTEIADILVSSDASLLKPSSLLSELQSSPIQGKTLARRLTVSQSKLSNTKSKMSGNRKQFEDWLQSVDIDGVRWVNVSDGNRSKGYVPSDDTPEDKLEILKNWLKN